MFLTTLPAYVIGTLMSEDILLNNASNDAAVGLDFLQNELKKISVTLSYLAFLSAFSVQTYFAIFTNNIHVFCLSCDVKKSKITSKNVLKIVETSVVPMVFKDVLFRLLLFLAIRSTQIRYKNH
jgi:hypothetical protein